jgi:hypothetical protein
MKRLYIAAIFMAVTTMSFAGGQGGMNHSSHSAASATSGSGVHFYGRLYVGYDHRSTGSANSVDSVRDNGGKSRMGIKFKENLGAISLIGNAEWKFDIADGTSTSDATNCTNAQDCRTFDLHIGNLGFATPLGYIGMGSFESPYKTMGMYDLNMDTAIALNQHGATSDGAFGIAGTWDSSVSYHAAMGPLEVAYMRGLSEQTTSNVQKSDYALGLKVSHMMPGLEFGFARNHDKSGDSGRGTSNDKIFASYKVMPGLAVFYTGEEVEVAGTNHGAGDINTYGAHYKMGHNMIQIAIADGNMDTATTDYDTISISNSMHLSKSTDVTIGYTRKGIEGAGNAVRSYGLGITHKF